MDSWAGGGLGGDLCCYIMGHWGVRQSVTYRYREFPVPEICHFFGGIGTGIGKNWYRKKVVEPVSEKFDNGTDFEDL